MYPHITYPEALVVGLIQGVTELFPLSSLGHNVLIPALVGGRWARDLSVSAPESPYLAFIVGLHVATAIAMIIYFWRDWVRIIAGFFGWIGQMVRPAPGTFRGQPRTTDQSLALMIILATIPVGIAGLALEHLFRTVFSKPVPTALFLGLNGLILFGGERLRKRGAVAGEEQEAADRTAVGAGRTAMAVAGARPVRPNAAGPVRGAGRHSSGQRAMKQQEADLAVQSDSRLVVKGFPTAIGLGAMQVLALLPGISRDGIVMVSGMFRGLSRQDAARFSFLLSAPVIFAAGVLKIGDLTGPLGKGIHGQVLAGSILSGVGAFLALRFFIKYVSNSSRTLLPFAIYCLVAGLGSAAYLGIK